MLVAKAMPARNNREPGVALLQGAVNSWILAAEASLVSSQVPSASRLNPSFPSATTKGPSSVYTLPDQVLNPNRQAVTGNSSPPRRTR